MEDFESGIALLETQIGTEGARYALVCTQYSDLVSYGWSYLEAQAGQDVPAHELWLDRLMAKLLAHAETLRSIAPPRLPDGARRLWDTSAWCAITRAIIDAHDAIEYLGVHPKSPEELDFRLLVWELHAAEQALRIRQMPGETSLRDAASIAAEIESLRLRVTGHGLFHTLHRDAAKSIESGNTPVFLTPQSVRNEQSGIHHDAYKGVMAYLSSHLHSHPASIFELDLVHAGHPTGYITATRVLRYATCFVVRALTTSLSMTGYRGNLAPPRGVDITLHSWHGFINKGKE